MQLYNAWSVSVRQMWDVPRETHRRFIEPLGGKHAASIIACNYASFIRFVSKSSKMAPLFALNRSLCDARTLTARNCTYIMRKLSIERRPIYFRKLDQEFIKYNFTFENAAADDDARINLIKETTDLRRKHFVLSSDDNFFNDDEYSSILRNACCS